jgi:hypothetical protein
MSPRWRSGSDRSGITRIEVVVIVVVALIGAGMVALLLGRGRENGLRMQCMNNLRRCGDGMVAYQTTNGFLPPARIAEGYATWAVLLAPQLDAKEPLKDWDTSETYFAQKPALRERLLPIYFCPARPRTSALSIEGDIDPATGKHVAGAVGDYAGVAGTGDPTHPWDGPDADGTIILGEVLKRVEDRIVHWSGRTSLPATQKERGLSQTLLIGEKHVPLGEEGRAAFGDGSLYDGQFPANSARVAGPGHGLAKEATDPFRTNFGSAHAGLCQFLRADGSVLPIAVNINEDVLGQMARRKR